ncbi:3-hydroxyacyl-CoA dehydrogenase NAD-binding domain-containing protein [Rhodococcus sp. UNC23MFCrub1.1]|uniref:3-hydroxyacyl-CoA dehydrogenase NAD-binding domain-containing protein n=1 Tax=Rhodococcus sp. UNC23MFCrub1.1 TaxID=1449068 RepID=UPI000ABA2EB8|nr:3-hydroxyacyl-CoA dehydrogenase NAD-binding domain-containing protein [Rhodococcus sp. UNC23MFCrub1.1]
MSSGTIAHSSTGSVVAYGTDGPVAVLTIDNPPVNASSAAVRAGLLTGLSDALADDTVEAVVLIGAGDNFISGSDLREFDGPVPEPTLPTVIAAIEASPKPVVAALSGATLGGGLELALACDARVARAGGLVGLPEITLGMIPGAGGTQRPLRILGPARTLELITSGRRLPVEWAAEHSLVDLVTEAPLRDAAVAFARDRAVKRVLLDLPVAPDEVPGDLERTAAKVLAKGGGRPQYAAAVSAVLSGVALPSSVATAFERSEFTRLRNGPEAAALRHLFFVRRETAKANRPSLRRAVDAVGVVGAGTMGAGIARAFVESGTSVVLVDKDPASARAAVDRLRTTYDTAIERGRMRRDEAESALMLLTPGQSISALEGCDLVIEAVFEDMAVKKDLLRRLQRVVRPDVTLATNTSYLDVDDLASVIERPGRLVGMHFFSPAHRAAVLEVVRGRDTSRESLDRALSAAAVLRKLPIVAGVCDGFIGNRIYNAYRRQCELMLEEGAYPEQIDRALVAFGFAMGPFAVSDMSGLDIAWRMRQSKAATRDPSERYPDVADTLCELGRFGQKTGSGWYRYPNGSRTPRPDPSVAALIEKSSAQKGIARVPFTDDQIVDRALLSMVNEAALLLSEAIADRAGDIDLMLTLAYGFPSHVGGLTPWLRAQSLDDVRRRLDQLAEVTGPGFTVGDPAVLL